MSDNNEILDDFEEDVSLHLEGSLLSKIWLSPKICFRYILKNVNQRDIIILVILGGISQAFDQVANRNIGDHQELAYILGVVAISGLIGGWLYYFIYGACLKWAGSWLNGHATYSDLRTVFAWSRVPTIFALPLVGIEIALFQEKVFQSEFYYEEDWEYIVWQVLVWTEVVLGIYTIVLLVIGISEAQKFSIGKAILNLLLAGLIIVVPIFLIALLFLL